MKKENVYVEVRTEKQARKLKKVFDVFKERINEITSIGLETGVDSDGDSQFDYPYIRLDNNKNWTGFGIHPLNKTKVSIKQLRNILAQEHLKEGDVCVFGSGYGNSRYKDVFEEVSKDIYKGQFVCKEGVYTDFIRYAKKKFKIEVGKWYKHADGGIVNYQGGNSGYGISNDGNWYNNSYWCFDGYNVEATAQEVEQALIKEAKKRGLDKGKVKCINGFNFNMHSGNFVYDNITNSMHYNGATIFKDGKWAEVIHTGKLKVEVDTTCIVGFIEKLGYELNDLNKQLSPEQKVVKYAESVDWDFEKVVLYMNSRDKAIGIFNKHNPHWELKKAFKKGKDIETLNERGEWYYCLIPLWYSNLKYRLRPLYVGDFVSYKSGDIRKVTEITESNKDHFSKRDCKVIKDQSLVGLIKQLW